LALLGQVTRALEPSCSRRRGRQPPYPSFVTQILEQGRWARIIGRLLSHPSATQSDLSSTKSGLLSPSLLLLQNQSRSICFSFSRHVLSKSAYQSHSPGRGDAPPQAPSQPPVTIAPHHSIHRTTHILPGPSLIRSLRHNFSSLLIDNYTDYLSPVEVSSLSKAEAEGEYLPARTLPKTPQVFCLQEAL
jgi:hypothetical protein